MLLFLEIDSSRKSRQSGVRASNQEQRRGVVHRFDESAGQQKRRRATSRRAKKRRRRRREKEGSGLGQGGSQFPSTPRRHEKWTESGGEFPRLIISLFCRLVASRRREKWRDRGMRFFVPSDDSRTIRFAPPRKIACQIGDNRLPRNTIPLMDWTVLSFNSCVLTLHAPSIFLHHYDASKDRGREDWWRSSGITFQREGRDAKLDEGDLDFLWRWQRR